MPLQITIFWRPKSTLFSGDACEMLEINLLEEDFFIKIMFLNVLFEEQKHKK